MADRDRTGKDSNPDLITGAPGSHPVGTGVGAAGAGAAGAAIGSMAGPVGTVVGAVVGAVAGGYAGKGVGEMVDPTAEDAYWRENYKNRPYVQKGTDYDQLAPAYRYGVESHQRHTGKNFDEVETHLRTDWESKHGSSAGMGWDKAKMAVRDSWDRVAGHGTPAAGATQSTTTQSTTTQASAQLTGQAGQTRQINAGQTAAIPVVEEEIAIGKREVERGGVRVRTEVEERPVEEQVQLREEHVRVERRPVDRPASEADINRAAQSGTIEVRERSEEAVVQKDARVVEEVVIGKEVNQRTETVRDTVRRTDVEVEDTGTTGTTKNVQQQQQRPSSGV